VNSTLRGAVYGILAAAIWGGMYVVSDVVLRVIPPFTLLSIRLIVGAWIVGISLTAQGKLIIPRADVMKLLGVGIVGFGISLGAQFVGTHLATAINGAVVTSASPAFILLFAWLILREPLTPIRVVAVLLASVGVAAVLDLSQLDLSSSTFAGNIALTIAALTWALYSVLVRLVSKNYPTMTISFYALVGGMLLSFPATALELRSKAEVEVASRLLLGIFKFPIGNVPVIGEITFGVILGILYLGVISTALAMVLWNRAFALVEASIASLFFFAQPLVGVLLATALLNQPLTNGLIIGAVLIVSGVLLSMIPTPVRAAQSPTIQAE
jgi:drug/metabolite transporter (DMT)-like permease